MGTITRLCATKYIAYVLILPYILAEWLGDLLVAIFTRLSDATVVRVRLLIHSLPIEPMNTYKFFQIQPNPMPNSRVQSASYTYIPCMNAPKPFFSLLCSLTH